MEHAMSITFFFLSLVLKIIIPVIHWNFDDQSSQPRYRPMIQIIKFVTFIRIDFSWRWTPGKSSRTLIIEMRKQYVLGDLIESFSELFYDVRNQRRKKNLPGKCHIFVTGRLQVLIKELKKKANYKNDVFSTTYIEWMVFPGRVLGQTRKYE